MDAERFGRLTQKSIVHWLSTSTGGERQGANAFSPQKCAVHNHASGLEVSAIVTSGLSLVIRALDRVDDALKLPDLSSSEISEITNSVATEDDDEPLAGRLSPVVVFDTDEPEQAVALRGVGGQFARNNGETLPTKTRTHPRRRTPLPVMRNPPQDSGGSRQPSKPLAPSRSQKQMSACECGIAQILPSTTLQDVHEEESPSRPLIHELNCLAHIRRTPSSPEHLPTPVLEGWKISSPKSQVPRGASATSSVSFDVASQNTMSSERSPLTSRVERISAKVFGKLVYRIFYHYYRLSRQSLPGAAQNGVISHAEIYSSQSTNSAQLSRMI